MNMRNHAVLFSGLLALSFAGCQKDGKTPAAMTLPAKAPVTGKVVVVATLEALPGAFPADDLYNYAYVLKYRVDSVVQGTIGTKEIFVAHYKPRLNRAKAKEETQGKADGSLDLFREGDRHYLVLNGADSLWQGPLEDNYPQDKSPRWWASWVERI